jgi:protein phosphatase
MRVLILSDIHGNIDALLALQERLATDGHGPEAILVLGDLVDYGPDPLAVVDWARTHATAVVCGNHDYAFATGEDCRSSPAFHPYAVATRDFWRPRIDRPTLRWLAALPRERRIAVAGSWLMVHATPRSPLFEYLAAGASTDEWEEACATAPSGSTIILVGHSHEPFVRSVGDRMVVNPGSLGLPKDGDPRGSYGLWDDGVFTLHRIAYDTERAAARLRALDLPVAIAEPLAAVLTTADPSALSTARHA